MATEIVRETCLQNLLCSKILFVPYYHSVLVILSQYRNGGLSYNLVPPNPGLAIPIQIPYGTECGLSCLLVKSTTLAAKEPAGNKPAATVLRYTERC